MSTVDLQAPTFKPDLERIEAAIASRPELVLKSSEFRKQREEGWR